MTLVCGFSQIFTKRWKDNVNTCDTQQTQWIINHSSFEANKCLIDIKIYSKLQKSNHLINWQTTVL